jgi:hypothetical protein
LATWSSKISDQSPGISVSAVKAKIGVSRFGPSPGSDQPGAGGAILARHPDIHQNDVERRYGGRRQGYFAATHCGDVDIDRRGERVDQLPVHGVVVGDEQTQSRQVNRSGA